MKGKTNVVRILDDNNIEFEYTDYGNNSDFMSGKEVAELLGVDPKIVFKTLLIESPDKEHYVAVISSDDELSLKKYGSIIGKKKLDMAPVQDLQKLTGYIKGGCSPIGMKRKFKTIIDDNAKSLDKIYVNAGKRGTQILISPDDLLRIIDGTYEDIKR